VLAGGDRRAGRRRPRDRAGDDRGERHRRGDRLESGDAGSPAAARRARRARGHPLHEPLLQDRPRVSRRRIRSRVAEAQPRLEPGLHARPGGRLATRRVSNPRAGRARGRRGGRRAVVIRTADVVIVGGGVTGVSIAFSLAERGVPNILVLERRFLASGGTGRSVGIVRQLYPTAETTQMVVRSLRVFQYFREVTG